MIAPETPYNEHVRLAALRQLGLLDTAPEESFDRITRLAQRAIGTPIALLSLVDADRQWFKSNQGLEATETPRDLSFCGHAIHNTGIFEVPDATTDHRFSDNPLVVGGPKIRSYAGCPIAAPDGSLIGTLCVIDTEQRSMSEADKAVLRDLVAIIEDELVLRRRAVDDDLTGLSNRRGFHLVADQSLAFCRRQQVPALLLYVDVAELTAVDDIERQPVSDQLVCEVSDVLRRAFREADVIARIGGDEFAALLTNYDFDPSVAVERFLVGLDNAIGPTTRRLVSIGSAHFDPIAPSTLDELLVQADADSFLSRTSRRLGDADS